MGTKLAPIPWILWGPALPFVNKGESAGSIPIILIFLFCSFKYFPTPDIVPPVPIPAKNISTFLPLLLYILYD